MPPPLRNLKVSENPHSGRPAWLDGISSGISLLRTQDIHRQHSSPDPGHTSLKTNYTAQAHPQDLAVNKTKGA